MNNFSLLSLFTKSDFVIIISTIIMLIGSVISWYIIVEKIRLWRRTKEMTFPKNTSVDETIKAYDKNLWFLSMTSAVAPFIGLFGTVWGVMHSFASIGAAKSVSISVVAPGLAVALGTTVVGLMVAIPATIAYQYFSKKSDDLYNELSNGQKK